MTIFSSLSQLNSILEHILAVEDNCYQCQSVAMTSSLGYQFDQLNTFKI